MDPLNLPARFPPIFAEVFLPPRVAAVQGSSDRRPSAANVHRSALKLAMRLDADRHS
jgi:hypothetical protein